MGTIPSPRCVFGTAYGRAPGVPRGEARLGACCGFVDGGLLAAHAVDVVAVLGEGLGEEVAAVAAGDEEEEGGLGRAECGEDGFQAGRGDRCGREAVGDVGVPGGGDLEVLGGEGRFPGAEDGDAGGVLGQGVLDGGVGLEALFDADAVPEDGGDDLALGWEDGFALNDGGDGEEAVQVAPAGR